MLKKQSGFFSVCLVVLALMFGGPRVGHAFSAGPVITGVTSAEYLAECNNIYGNAWLCNKMATLWDPLMQDVTALSLTLKYDPLFVTFDPANSGPLGIFSVGGDAPPPKPGIGTEPMRLLPSSGYAPGAQLPGSTLTYTDVGGILTVDYRLASPITVNSEVNFFRLSFDFVKPLVIDLPQSTVTYETTGPGNDFTTLSFDCTTTDPIGGCGSATPSTGMTINYSLVPEPNTFALLFVGLGCLGFVARRWN